MSQSKRMADANDEVEDTNHLYLEPVQSGLPRLSDISHASDGKIHVDSLRLAPSTTNDVDEVFYPLSSQYGILTNPLIHRNLKRLILA